MKLNLQEKYPDIEITGDLNEGEFCIINSRVHGLFANFYCILYGLYICEEENLKPIIELGKDHLYYDPKKGDNIFTYFYEQSYKESDITLNQLARIKVIHPNIFLKWCRISTAEKVTSNLLIEKYFNLRPDIRDAIDTFCDKNFKKSGILGSKKLRILGVHYRGTDKAEEHPIIPFKEYEKRIDSLLKNNICDKVLFISDELHLRNHVKNKYKEKVILYNLEADYSEVYSGEQKALHLIKSSSYLHAKDALVECYLLSKCLLLMSSHKSSMSLFSTFLNPDITHIVIEP